MRLGVLGCAVLLLPLLPAPSAAARPCGGKVGASGGDGSFHAEANRSCPGRGSTGSSSTGARSGSDADVPRYVQVTTSPCPGNHPDAMGRVNGMVNCNASAHRCPPGQWYGVTYTAVAEVSPTRTWSASPARCIDTAATAPDAPPVVLPVVTAADLRRVPLPGGAAAVQPASHRVAVNLPVNVYTTAEPLTVPVVVLGFPVRIRATPVRFTWSFGDGGTLGPTEDPGAPYPDLRTTHVYERPGRYRVVLTTTYAGEYSVDGGPWLDIDGTAAVDGPAVELTALAGSNVLLAP
ncbi:PKD domain-containing protein [Kineococcus glutinatus]|uniref:PKD domain-containing protein n=1 Tax=Kineococcus glutinatus TaxID=1070872 RepID=A0ABP9HBJ0_9ACTN